ncbi:MAG: tetratricopeptide repeat protein [Gemmatimonadota bacterium]|nr:MAG: tetratricopeptide repeat protein [Gemmatimonadota bacterium]
MSFNFLQDLFKRRVPHILGLYLGASWVVIEFVSLLVDRFYLSPHLIEFSLVLLASLVPTVVLLAYVHGRPGPDEWTKAEKIGIPFNLLASAAILLIMFGDQDLGAATRTLQLESEEGRTVERVIPKSEFRRKLALFYFENETGDTALDWLQLGLPVALWLDLDQDLFLSVVAEFQGHLNRAGYPEGVGLPPALRARIAEQLHVEHFVVGSFSGSGDDLSLRVSLHETERRTLLAENSYSGGDVFALVDRMSVQLRRDLGLPDRHIEEMRDLPIADMLTRSLGAYRLFSSAVADILIRGEWAPAKEHLEAAVREDPSFAFAQYTLFEAYLYFGERENAEEAARLAMQHVYKLPERRQFDLKYAYYNDIEEDPNRRFAVAKMRVELFPEDIEGRAQLAWEYWRRGQTDRAIAEYEQIYEIDPSQYDYFKMIGSLYLDRGEFDKALDYYQQFAERAPNDPVPFQVIGDLYFAMGDHERAQGYLERALIIDPHSVGAIIEQGHVAFQLGRFFEALDSYERALAASAYPPDRRAVYAALRSYHETRGQLARAIDYLHLEIAEWERFQPPGQVLLMKLLDSPGLYARAGREDLAFETLHTAEEGLVAPYDKVVPLGYLEVYLELGDADRAQESLEGLEPLMDWLGTAKIRHNLLYEQGRIHELRGEYRRAIESYQGSLRPGPMMADRNQALGRCYRILGELETAQESLERNLEVLPFSPGAHYEIARVYAELGDRDRALEHVQVALEIWGEADPDFRPALEAQGLLAELSALPR